MTDLDSKVAVLENEIKNIKDTLTRTTSDFSRRVDNLADEVRRMPEAMAPVFGLKLLEAIEAHEKGCKKTPSSPPPSVITKSSNTYQIPKVWMNIIAAVVAAALSALGFSAASNQSMADVSVEDVDSDAPAAVTSLR